MENVDLIGVRFAKAVVQLPGASSDGIVAFRKKLSRSQFNSFVERHPRSRAAVEGTRLCKWSPVRWRNSNGSRKPG